MIMMTTNRMQHSLAVARKMKKTVEDAGNRYPCTSEEAYLLGYLHDIGYEFAETQKEHAHAGGLLLKEQRYPYWKEVFYHGEVQAEYDSPLLRLLNYVDMTTGPDGTDFTMKERLQDIAVRYGADSMQFRNAEKLAQMLIEGSENVMMSKNE